MCCCMFAINQLARLESGVVDTDTTRVRGTRPKKTLLFIRTWRYLRTSAPLYVLQKYQKLLVSHHGRADYMVRLRGNGGQCVSKLGKVGGAGN